MSLHKFHRFSTVVNTYLRLQKLPVPLNWFAYDSGK